MPSACQQHYLCPWPHCYCLTASAALLPCPPAPTPFPAVPAVPACREVGKVDTKHIKVGLAVKTILDNVEEGWEEDQVPVADDNSNLFLETAAPAPSDSRPNGAAAEVRGDGWGWPMATASACCALLRHVLDG